jgi:hypothetical protein
MGKDKNKLLGIAAILVTTLVVSIWYGASHVLPVLDTAIANLSSPGGRCPALSF